MRDDRNDSGIKRPDHPAQPAFENAGSWPEEDKIAFRERRLPEAQRAQFEAFKKQQDKARKNQEERLHKARAQLEKERQSPKPTLTYDPEGMKHRKGGAS